jgi:hypothetical protein
MRLFITMAFVLISALLCAQQPDSLRIPIDSIPVSLPDSGQHIAPRSHFIHHFFTDKYPDPKKALLLSLILPGSGQAYNKKWWKIPLVYAAVGGMTWWTIDNVREYHDARDNYLWLVDTDPNTNPVGKYATGDRETLKSYRDLRRHYAEQTYLGLGLVYLLSLTDAFVDAHLAHFDVNDDLTLGLKTGIGTPGLGFTLTLDPRPSRAVRGFSTNPSP